MEFTLDSPIHLQSLNWGSWVPGLDATTASLSWPWHWSLVTIARAEWQSGEKGEKCHKCPQTDACCVVVLALERHHQDSWAQASLKTSPTHWCAATRGQRLAASGLCGVSVVGAGGARVYLYSPRTFRCLLSFRSPASIIWNLREGCVTCGLLFSSAFWLPNRITGNVKMQGLRPASDLLTQNLWVGGHRVTILTTYRIIPITFSAYLWISFIFRLKPESYVEHSDFPKGWKSKDAPKSLHGSILK